MSDYSRLLHELARRTGILDAYHDLWGASHAATDATLYALLGAMGLRADDEQTLRRNLDELDASEGRALCEPVALLPAEGPQAIPLHRAAPGATVRFYGETLAAEPDVDAQGRPVLRLVSPLPAGVYDAEVAEGGGGSRLTLIVSPPSGHRPPTLAGGGRLWGINLPLYGLRSADDWGVGDFDLLARIIPWAASRGADAVGLLPLHALFNEPPLGASPYYPSSRLFLNPLYIHVESAPCAASPEARAFLDDEATRRAIATLRAEPLVDYAGAWGVKRRALEVCHRVFLREASAEEQSAFAEWRRRSGVALERFVLHAALRERLLSPEGYPTHWRAWPAEFRHPDTPAVRRFAEEQAQALSFHAFLQWVADGQLQKAAQAARDAGMEVGLYLDMALGVDPGGADAWCHQDVLALDASAGCPPDPFSLLGQKWGLPPLIPRLHRESGYALLRQTVGRNAFHAGAIRIDHAASLARLFWIPGDRPAREGAYVGERLEELLALLRALSASEQCLIVGEDLGTVPQEVRDGLAASGFLSYRLLMFEREDSGAFKAPGRFPADALVSFGTHDLPTFDGWLLGHDLAVKTRLNRYPDDKARRDERDDREAARLRLVEALSRENLLPEGFAPDPSPGAELSPAEREELAVAAHRYLARTPSALLLVNLDDLLGEVEMQNLPGTLDEHPNWRRRASSPWETWKESRRVNRLLEAVEGERGGKNG